MRAGDHGLAKCAVGIANTLTPLALLAKGCGLVNCCERTIEHDSADYPRRLRGLTGMPDTLHVRGLFRDWERVIAIVGGRAARADEIRHARGLARALAETGACILSGGALGIDTAAHLGALDAARPTVAVLGSGLAVPYPQENIPLFDDIITRGGALVSQFPVDAPPRSWHFVRRNRTMAGMADAVIIIGASRDSGSLHTARAARLLGRVVGAVPGSPGCELLLASGAARILSAEDLESALAGRPQRPSLVLPDSASIAGLVLAYLDDTHAHHPDEIASHTGLGIRDVTRALTGLELDGLAILLPGRNYLRSALARELLAS